MSYDHFEEELSPQINLTLWRKVLRFAGPYRRSWVIIFFAATLTTASQTLFHLITKWIIDLGITQGDMEAIVLFGGLMMANIVVNIAAVLFFIRHCGKVSTHMSHDIRRAGFERLQELSFSYYDQRPVGWLMARMTSDCDRLGRFMSWGFLDMIWGTLMMIIYAGVMLWLNWKLALVVLTVIPLLAWISHRFQHLFIHSSRRMRRINSRLTATFNEGIVGVITSKTMVREKANLGEFTGLSGEMYSASVRFAIQAGLYLPLVLALGSLGTGLALWLGGNQVMEGAMTLGTLWVFINFSRELFYPLNDLARIFAEMQVAQACGERVISLIETEPEIRDSPAVAAAIEQQQREPVAGRAIDGGRPTIGRIKFDRVTFQYQKGPMVLKDFSLEVEAGSSIALVGPTGGGKSTIVSLLCRFYEPTEGRVLFDGVDYRERSLGWLQSNLGIVLQTPHLFSGTIRDNIRYGRLEASEEEIWEAVRRVGANRFIESLESGIDSIIGENGINLSTGQKQLVSFARAVLADPQIFVLDEATSSIDTETEMVIQHGIEEVLRDRTSFIIAHRLSTIRSADRILVIEDGRIAEAGNHSELLAQRGRYYELYTHQFTHLRETELLGTDYGEPEAEPQGG